MKIRKATPDEYHMLKRLHPTDPLVVPQSFIDEMVAVLGRPNPWRMFGPIRAARA